MIRSFGDRETQRLFDGQGSRRFQAIARQAAVRLNYIHTARSLEDIRARPGNRLELLSGAREGQYSIRINRQWRICFRWVEGAAYDVEIVDYH